MSEAVTHLRSLSNEQLAHEVATAALRGVHAREDDSLQQHNGASLTLEWLLNEGSVRDASQEARYFSEDAALPNDLVKEFLHRLVGSLEDK